MNSLVLAFVRRRPVRVGPDKTPAMANVRPFEDITPDNLPDPIRSGDFANEGKAFGRTRMPIAIAGYQPEQWRSVSEQEFGRHPVLEAAPANAAVPHGSMLPFKERTNIARGQSVAYGSLVIANPHTYDYGLLARDPNTIAEVV